MSVWQGVGSVWAGCGQGGDELRSVNDWNQEPVIKEAQTHEPRATVMCEVMMESKVTEGHANNPVSLSYPLGACVCVSVRACMCVCVCVCVLCYIHTRCTGTV